MSTVKIGDRDITVEEPSIYKTELIGNRLARIGKDAPEIQIKLGDFISKYEKSNVTEIDRATAEYQLGDRIKGISDEGWKARGNVLRLPRSPTGTEQILFILPVAFEKASQQALEIAAIFIAPNSELENEGEVEKTIKKHFGYLRHHGKPSDVVKLLAAATEVVKEVIEAHKEEVGKLRSFWASITRAEEPQSEHEAALAEVTATLGETGGSPASTDSPPDTDGTTETSPIDSAPAMSSISSD